MTLRPEGGEIRAGSENLHRMVGGPQTLNDLGHSRQRVCSYRRGIQGAYRERLTKLWKGRQPSGWLVPTFRSPRHIAATPFADFGKLWALGRSVRARRIRP